VRLPTHPGELGVALTPSTAVTAGSSSTITGPSCQTLRSLAVSGGLAPVEKTAQSSSSTSVGIVTSNVGSIHRAEASACL